MASSDHSAFGAVLERARRFALDIEGRTTIGPAVGGDEERMVHYDALVTDPALRRATHSLYASEHYVQAVNEAYKVVNNTVKKRAGTSDKDGASMMMVVFDR